MYNQSLLTHARCRICNSVAFGEIASELGEMSSYTFRLEDDGLGFLCNECDNEIDELESEYFMDDDIE